MIRRIDEYKQTIADIEKVSISGEASDRQDLKYEVAQNGKYEGKYVALCSDIFLIKDETPYLVTNLYTKYDYDKNVFNVKVKGEVEIPLAIEKKLTHSKLKSKDGNDMIFMHGTDNDFKDFKMEFVGHQFGNMNRFRGLFFTAIEDDAALYGQNVKIVAIDSKKPIQENSKIYKKLHKEWSNDEHFKKDFQYYIIEKGYDSIVLIGKYGRVVELIIFNPSQIYLIEEVNNDCVRKLNQVIDTG